VDHEIVGSYVFVENKRFQKSILPYLSLTSGIIILSLSGFFVRWANVPGLVTSFFRIGIAAVLMTPFMIYRTLHGHPIPKSFLLFPILSGIFTAFDHGFWSSSLAFTSVANATVINNMAPLWVALIAAVLWKQKLAPRFWFGLFLALAGGLLIFGNDVLVNFHLNKGDFLALASSLFYAAYFLVTQRGRDHWDTITYVWIVNCTAAVTLLGANLIVGNPLQGFPPQTYIIFLITALLSQVLGYFSVVYALGHLPASTVSPTMIVSPILSALLAIPLLHEGLALLQIAGGLSALTGIFIVNHNSSETKNKVE
jgi:drug/metabolite transporter (DMT)-like permease